MADNRRAGLSKGELDHIAEQIAGRINVSGTCKLTDEQQQAVVDLIATKKKAVKWTLFVIGAFLVWVLKDVYAYVVDHIAWGGR